MTQAIALRCVAGWRRLLAGLLLAACAGVSGAHADTAQFNGTWAVDPARAGDFVGALKDFNDKLVALHKKKVRATRGAFEGLGGELSSNNAHAGQYKEANQRSRAHVIGWEVSDEIHTVLEAKTIKLYQAEKCAILYDKSVKRLISINPAGGSGALANNASTHDDIGRSTSYFETGGLVIDTDIEGGDRLVETFTLNRGGNELTVAAKLRRGDIGRPLEFKRVYTRVE